MLMSRDLLTQLQEDSSKTKQGLFLKEGRKDGFICYPVCEGILP